MSAAFDGPMGFERRMSGEARVGLEAGDRRIRGTAIVFHSLSENLGGFREIIHPEAVDRTLREGIDVRALVDHDSAKIMGRLSAGTLTLSKTARGLAVENDPPNTSYARDLLVSIDRRDITGMSFGFRVAPDGDAFRQDDQTGEWIRDVHDMLVSEVSFVTFPAYVATDAREAQRSMRAAQALLARPSLAQLRRRLALLR
jgi:HK97 family phage prohead protease